ncbi:MAG TPA: tetratricopeptide repeat protein, partial [Bryobacteraceae bacterium]|nr:tetratricopeptide repeat protein [Bryobacteraceae bacterium]
YGLPAGEDFDGKVLSQAFVKAPHISFIRSWEEVPGADGRHPPHTRLDPVAAHEALEQMIALGYIERPDENCEAAVEKTIHELRYNLGEAYQDGDRHVEAYEIFSQLHAADGDEQRFAVRLFVSCQALGMHAEMRRIVEELDGTATAAAAPRPPVIDYLKAQVLTVEKRYGEALAALERVTEAHLLRPGLFLQTADLYMRLRRWRDAQQVYEKALAIDPDNAQAYVGLCRLALRRRKFSAAAHAALDALQRIYGHPPAHFLLGRALAGMQEYARAADAFRAAISFNPNFPEAHVRLAALLEKRLGDAESAREHRRLARLMRSRGTRRPARQLKPDRVERAEGSGTQFAANTAEMPPVAESLVVVTGLPRSGTSLLMQMLTAGGMDILSDGLRKADADNPRGYLEFEPVKKLMKDSKWLFEGRGKAVKIVAPLLAALPPGLACRVILCERDLDEVLDSQERMLKSHNRARSAAPQRRRMLTDEYARTLARVRAMLARRAGTQVLAIEHGDAICDAIATAGRLNEFLGGGLDVAKMAAAVDPTLHRRRTGVPL